MQANLGVRCCLLAMGLVLGACTASPDEEVAVTRAEYPVESVREPEAEVVTDHYARSDAVRPRAFALLNSAVPPLPSRNRENYTAFDDNPVKRTSESPVSTFSIDVDTASYANVRRLLNRGALPPHDAVRVEEMINYFAYDYSPPDDASHPFAVHTEVGPSPWHPDRVLLHVGLKGYEVPRAELPAANLVFLIDVSGSMQGPDRIDLLKASLKLLTRQLRSQDRISIAVYAGATGTVLEPTPGDRHGRITAAIDQLVARGSTNGGAGIQLAYSLAEDAFIDGGINRVILATDGDFNVGTVDQRALKALVEDRRNSGVGLTVLGFGGGNYNDALMQELAQIGNGNAAYIDNLNEARKVLVDEMSSTLHTIAQDVKIQVEFNPARVAEHRLIGYETRRLEREDFNNDQVDAGDIGAGHTVTALYELALTGSGGQQSDPLRYQSEAVAASHDDELAFLRLRYKRPGERRSVLQAFPISGGAVERDLAGTSANFRFSAAVAAFGQLLRGGRYTGELDFDAVLDLARAGKGADDSGYRGEFLSLVMTADALTTRKLTSRTPE